MTLSRKYFICDKHSKCVLRPGIYGPLLMGEGQREGAGGTHCLYLVHLG
jgi:hypothetical protein